MIVLNLEKLKFSPEQTQEINGIEITDEELTKLISHTSDTLTQSEEQRVNLKQRIEDHVGNRSAYTMKQNIRQSLKVVYDKIINSETVDSNKASIAFKLNERAMECTPGFHDGINSLVISFFSPKTMNDLLGRLLESLVSSVANKLTDEVHTNNRVFTVANAQGYAVHAINKDDIYHGNLTDQKIIATLEKEINEKMNLFSTLSGLKDVLNGSLTDVGYSGYKEEPGYFGPVLEKMNELIQTLFSSDATITALKNAEMMDDQSLTPMKKQQLLSEKAQKYYDEFYITNEDYCFNINWSKIKQCLWDKIKQGEYFNFTSNENEALDSLFELGVDDVDVLSQHFFSIANNTDNLINALNFFHEIPFSTQCIVIKTFLEKKSPTNLIYDDFTKIFNQLKSIEQKKELFRTCYPLIISSVGNDIKTLRDVIHFMSADEIADQLTANVNPNKWLDLIHSATKHLEDFKLLLDAVKRCPDEVKKRVLTTKDSLKRNLLLVALDKSEDVFNQVFALMEGCSSEVRADVLKGVDSLGKNVLMLAAQYNLNAIPSLIKGIESLKNEPFKNPLKYDLWTYVSIPPNGYKLNEHDVYKRNALMLAVCRSNDISALMAEITKLPKVIKQTILTQVDSYEYNPLMLAAKYNSDAINCLTNEITNLSDEDVRSILFDNNSSGNNALMLAANDNPKAIKPLLVWLASRKDNTLNAEVLKEVNLHDENALMLLLSNSAEQNAVQTMIDSISQCSDEDKAIIFEQTDVNGNNSLMLAAKHSPDSIDVLINGCSEKIINSLFKHANINDHNALTRAILSNPSSIAPLIKNMKHCSQSTKEEIFKAIFSSSDANLINKITKDSEIINALIPGILSCSEDTRTIFFEKNVLNYAITHNTTAVIPLIQALIHCPKTLIKTIFMDNYPPNSNLLEWAVENQPSEIPALLHCMQSLDSDTKFTLLNSVKRSLKKTPSLLNDALNCIASMDLPHQQEFYQYKSAAHSRKSDLSKYGVCELVFQQLIEKCNSNETLANEINDLFSHYKVNRNQQSLIQLHKEIQTLLLGSEAISQFSHHQDNRRFSLFSSPETTYDWAVKSLNSNLNIINPEPKEIKEFKQGWEKKNITNKLGR